ncbi:MAG: 30S ribosomal protein S3 [Oscillospiraceae bacterium]|nr:30S ribosomal protein S3 [Oscillospiraceae bacterium]MDD4367777.1 30S ribosomal protein S3 [Oscillospiraceae bacterium]
MGQKINPHGFRVGVIKDWDTKWYADKKSFSTYLVEDKAIRDFVKKECFAAGCPRIEIERKGDEKTVLTIWAAKPGIVIGRQGSGIDSLKKKLKTTFGKDFLINVNEVKNQDVDAQLVAESIAAQLEKRISFRRAMKQAMGRAMKAGAKGIKTQVSGRLGGAEIARAEHYHEGTIPLQTLRADIDYGFAEANTTAGRIGVKVWVFRGEVFKSRDHADKQVEGGKA